MFNCEWIMLSMFASERNLTIRFIVLVFGLTLVTTLHILWNHYWIGARFVTTYFTQLRAKKKHMHIFRSVFYRTCQLFVKFENSQHTVNYRWPLNKPQKSTESHVWLWNTIFSHCLMKVACNSVVVLCVFFFYQLRGYH